MDDCTRDPALDGATCSNCRARQNEQLRRARFWDGEYEMLEPGDVTGRTLRSVER